MKRLQQTKPFLCVGGANLDRKIQSLVPLQLETSNPAVSSQSLGGVARNIAENLSRMGAVSALYTVVGDDAEGRHILTSCQKAGIDTHSAESVRNVRTGNYTAVLDSDGSLSVAVADMNIYDLITPERVSVHWNEIKLSRVVIADTNLPGDTLGSIISHGMPYPVNVQTAAEVEQIIRDEGAVPATIAILDGKIRVGLSHDNLEQLAQSKDVLKVSRRDLPYALSTGKTGATTVAATMICAHLTGISVFVTGGIGGVHRGAEQSMDISADLLELSKTNVAVVCAGAKSILDIGLTLETQGVPVIGYRTQEFPAFYSRVSGFEANYRLDTAHQVAAFLETKWSLGLEGGTVIANPVPAQDELPRREMDAVINQALQEAESDGIRGKEVTPFLLDKVKELTNGESLKTNVALVRHNAHVGAGIALALNSSSSK